MVASKKKKIVSKKVERVVFPLAKIKQLLPKIKGWKATKGSKAIVKEFVFKDFLQAMVFVGHVAEIAEEAQHHPDIFIAYNHVILQLSTHSAGGLTENDFILAARVNAVKSL